MKFHLNIRSTLLTACLFLFTAPHASSHGECLSKVELSPAYIHIDVIECTDTVKELDMAGIQGNLAVAFGRGWIIKPSALYGRDKDGELVNASIGFGRCVPIMDRWIVTPLIGVAYTSLGATIHLDLGPLGEVKFSERFQAVAPFAGLEVVYKLAPNWRICANAQYAWSHSKTKVKELFTSKSDSEGPSYGALLEYDINQSWSVNIGAAYNESYSKEKNGIRGRGAKIGLARWF